MDGSYVFAKMTADLLRGGTPITTRCTEFKNPDSGEVINHGTMDELCRILDSQEGLTRIVVSSHSGNRMIWVKNRPESLTIKESDLEKGRLVMYDDTDKKVEKPYWYEIVEIELYGFKIVRTFDAS